ncbi:hypothetical protein NDU88_003061 [Pleurodeles waltl]|uniref:Uncharacterized protein n=1 Tax=Pleurodeles waltl TaxID=8319 RepID=A0AAV7UXD5_PLEWA|nr:hypothetical protein NDU88_003061 [Pleurodeles waltl]
MIHNHYRQPAWPPAGKKMQQSAQEIFAPKSHPQTSGVLSAQFRQGRCGPPTSHSGTPSRPVQKPPVATSSLNSGLRIRPATRHLQVQPKTRESQLRPKPGSASPLTTGAPALTQVRPEMVSPHQQSGYFLRPDLAGDIPHSSKAWRQPNRVHQAAISLRRPP